MEDEIERMREKPDRYAEVLRRVEEERTKSPLEVVAALLDGQPAVLSRDIRLTLQPTQEAAMVSGDQPFAVGSWRCLGEMILLTLDPGGSGVEVPAGSTVEPAGARLILVFYGVLEETQLTIHQRAGGEPLTFTRSSLQTRN